MVGNYYLHSDWDNYIIISNSNYLPDDIGYWVYCRFIPRRRAH